MDKHGRPMICFIHTSSCSESSRSARLTALNRTLKALSVSSTMHTSSFNFKNPFLFSFFCHFVPSFDGPCPRWRAGGSQCRAGAEHRERNSARGASKSKGEKSARRFVHNGKGMHDARTQDRAHMRTHIHTHNTFTHTLPPVGTWCDVFTHLITSATSLS